MCVKDILVSRCCSNGKGTNSNNTISKAEDKEEPAQNSGVNHEEDDDINNAEGNNELEEDVESDN